jgi:hypothetical protein
MGLPDELHVGFVVDGGDLMSVGVGKNIFFLWAASWDAPDSEGWRIRKSRS